jgi:hypothetical protein
VGPAAGQLNGCAGDPLPSLPWRKATARQKHGSSVSGQRSLTIGEEVPGSGLFPPTSGYGKSESRSSRQERQVLWVCVLTKRPLHIAGVNQLLALVDRSEKQSAEPLAIAGPVVPVIERFGGRAS